MAGAGVNKFQIDVKGDVHELIFSGPAADVLDSCQHCLRSIRLGRVSQLSLLISRLIIRSWMANLAKSGLVRH